MKQRTIFRTPNRRPDPVPRLLSGAALLVAIAALVSSMLGSAPAAKSPMAGGDSGAKKAKPAKEKNAKADVAKQKKAAAKAREASAKLKKELAGLKTNCPVSGAVDLGSWCLDGSTFRVPASELGQNNYFYAAQKCVAEGGWLPTAAQLIGAAAMAPLKSTIDDDPGSSGASEFPEASVGIKDEREMTSDLFTTGAGARAAGSEGVTAGSKGVGNLGEPDPVPMPAEPSPETLDYVTVYDNHNMGGFAGGAPVSKPENFRCAYAKGYEGKPRDISGRS